METDRKFAGAAKWKRDFPLLNNYDLDKVYLTILSLAKSVRDVRRLHNFLPENCRLLRCDLIKLEEYWQSVILPLGRSESQKRDDQELIRWILLRQCPSWSNYQSYYAANLKSRAIPRPKLESDESLHRPFHFKLHQHSETYVLYDYGSTLIDADENEGIFTAKICGLPFHIEFRIWQTGEIIEMLARLMTEFHLLTEPATYQLLEKMPAYFEATGHDAYRLVNFCFILDSKRLCAELQHIVSYTIQKRWQMMTGFPLVATKFLKDLCIPIEDETIIWEPEKRHH